MSSAISSSIDALVLSEKSDQLNALKEFLTTKIEDSEEICSMIDDFSSLLTDSGVKLKLGKSSKSSSKNKEEKKKRKKSYYSHFLSERLKVYSEEHKDAKVNRKEKMLFVGNEWKEFKKSDDFEKKKAEWDEIHSSESSDTNSVSIVKSKEPSKSSKKSKVSNKTKKEKVVPDVSDSDSDNNDDDKAKVSPIQSDSDDSSGDESN